MTGDGVVSRVSHSVFLQASVRGEVYNRALLKSMTCGDYPRRGWCTYFFAVAASLEWLYTSPNISVVGTNSVHNHRMNRRVSYGIDGIPAMLEVSSVQRPRPPQNSWAKPASSIVPRVPG